MQSNSIELLRRHIATHTERSAEDRAAVSTLETFLISEGRINTNFSCDDKWPNHDGTFEFVSNPELSRTPEQNFIVQIKGTHTYTEADGVISYSLKSLAFPAFIAGEVTADPGILFIVLNPDVRGQKRVFWKYLSPSVIEAIDFEKNSTTIKLTSEDEIEDTDESVDKFCDKLRRIVDFHLFLRKLNKDSLRKEDAIKIVETRCEDISQEIDRIKSENKTRDHISRRIVNGLYDLCYAVLVLNAISLQNWKRECEKFAPDLRCCVHHGAFRTGRFKEFENYDVVIISYSIAVNDASILNMVDWKLVVLDEAQNIKNPGSERTKFVKKIPRKCSIAVTGTPFENHVSDIWSLVDFVIPGLFGTQAEYNNAITDDIEGADKIEPMLSPIMIRRMVKDVATDLPEKVVIPQPLIMSAAESKKYEEFREEAQGSTESGNLNLGVLQKLRMFCTHPAICDDEECKDYYAASVKYQRFCEILEEVCSLKEKVIMFTSYQKMFDIVDKDVPDRYDIPVWKINGSTPVEERQHIVDVFNEFQGSALLVLNPRAAGTGLNITAANHVIHYNLEWNPALEDQASARAYRRGQQKTVFVYRFYYEDTVEQIVNERIERKREMASTAVVGTDGKVENREDIIAALNISPIKEAK